MEMYGWQKIRNLLLELLIQYKGSENWDDIIDGIKSALIDELDDSDIINAYNEWCDYNYYETFGLIDELEDCYNKDEKSLHEIIRDFEGFDFSKTFFKYTPYGFKSYTKCEAVAYIIDYCTDELMDYIWDYQPSMINDFAEYIDFINEWQGEVISDEVIEDFKSQCY